MQCSIKVRANVVIDNTGNIVSIPVIVTSEGVLRSYLDYLVVYRNRSQSWIERSVFSIRLLVDYVDANKDVFTKPKDLFREFSNCLFSGTIDEHSRDPSDLYWKPRQEADAESLINYITHYTDWLAIEIDDAAIQLNPFRAASRFEQKLNWAAYYQKRHRSFLSHLWRKQDAKKKTSTVRSIQRRRSSNSSNVYSVNKAFPEGRLIDLLYDGFVYPGKDSCIETHDRLNLRDVLITLLMHFGGLRISEAIQLYVVDIARVNNDIGTHVVKVYDPVNGASPLDEIATRREYLSHYFSLKPRCQYPRSKRQFAGWKNPLLTNQKGKFFTVVFFSISCRRVVFCALEALSYSSTKTSSSRR